MALATRLWLARNVMLTLRPTRLLSAAPSRCFARFGALLAGEPLSEADSLRAWPETHERYAEQYGVDPELGRKTFAEHRAQR